MDTDSSAQSDPDLGAGVDRRTIGTAFSPRQNSLNFIRLLLAVAVIISHATTIGGYGSETVFGKTTLGTVAVYGFFGLSGFLIAGSATRNGVGRYLWQRVLRIFPAFWICLVAVAFVFGLLTWWHQNPVQMRVCGLHCYLSEPNGPVGYVVHNFWLQIHQPTITGTLPFGLFRDVWNGSLWTLAFEFLCYLILAVLSVVGLLRHRLAVAVLALTVWITEIAITSIPSLAAQFSPAHLWYPMKLLSFVPIFLGGSLVYLYRERIPDSGALAMGATALFTVGFLLPLGNGVPAFTFTSVDLTAVVLIYPLLWLGIHLPFQRIGARNDYSYGVYIYGFPVQQILVVWGLNRWGYVPYTLISMIVVGPCALASWWVVEKHALKLKSLRLPHDRDSPAVPIIEDVS